MLIIFDPAGRGHAIRFPAFTESAGSPFLRKSGCMKAFDEYSE